MVDNSLLFKVSHAFAFAPLVGGLDKFGSLNFAIPSIAASSLLFLYQQVKGDNYYSAVNNAKYIFPSINENDFILSFVNDKYLIKPFDATNHHEPAKVSCYHYC